MKKTIFLISGAILLTGISLWAYDKYKNSDLEKSPDSPGNNFDALLKNLGAAGKVDSKGAVPVVFNDKNNLAVFYNNNRVIIFESGMMGTAPNQIAKGSYSNGGLIITIDGKQPVTSGSVFSNLLKTI